MESKWYELKPQIINLRKKGTSMTKIEKIFGVPRSTLSSWFKNIKLTKKQKTKLLKNSSKALIKARKKAVMWHNEGKRKRLQEAKENALSSFSKLDIKDNNILELTLALLYLGEGSKKTVETSLANTDPLILNFFIGAVRRLYNTPTSKLICELHIRADQNPERIRKYWSKKLKLPLKNFKNPIADKRTLGSKTYPYYKGVCNVRCGAVAIQRKLVYLSRIYCEKIANNKLGS
ncbi:MAG: hypothetical protein ABH833_04535 [Parcubacteria group bacterium]